MDGQQVRILASPDLATTEQQPFPIKATRMSRQYPGFITNLNEDGAFVAKFGCLIDCLGVVLADQLTTKISYRRRGEKLECGPPV
jgi:hypothetical protein